MDLNYRYNAQDYNKKFHLIVFYFNNLKIVFYFNILCIFMMVFKNIAVFNYDAIKKWN